MEKKRRMNQKHLLRRTLYVCSGALLLFNSGVGVAGILISHQNQVQASQVSPRIGLADVSILQDAQFTSTTGTQMTPNAQGNYDLSLNYTGKGVASVGVADQKTLVFALPAELQGKVVGESTIDIQANLLPITPGNLPGIKPLFDALGLAVNGLDAVFKIPAVVAAYNGLKTVQDFGAYQETLPAKVSADGKTITVNFTQGFGHYVHQAYVTLFDTLRDAIDAINVTNPFLNPLVKALQEASDQLFAILDAIASGGSNLLDSALNGNLLGSVSGTLHATVSDPGVASATVKAGAINNALVSADLLTAIEQEGESVTLHFPTAAVNPIEDYVVAEPTLTQPVEGQTQVAGQVTLTQPIPAGTTFEAVVTLPDGTAKNVPVAADGKFVVATDSLVTGQTVTAKVVATNGQYTKASSEISASVVAAPIENPIADYNVATPSVTPVKQGDATIDGHVELAQPIPTGTTFTAIATLADGTELKGTVGSDGQFKITGADQLMAGDTATVRVVATNGQYTKDSSTVTVTVEAAPVEDPLANYQVAQPTVEQSRAGDTTVKGHVELAQPIPAGTTFEATVTLPGGRQVAAVVKDNGDFTVPTEAALVAGSELTVHVTAINGAFTKAGAPITTQVADALPTNPLVDYEVSAPIVNPATAGDQAVQGHVNLVTPIPNGTTFTALMTLADGTTETANVLENGDFEIPTRSLVADEMVTVKVIAQNGTFQKESSATSITVSEVVVTDPLADYTVAAPVINPVSDTDTQVTGQVTLNTPIPDGTTFEAIVKLADGSTKRASISPDGQFSIPTGQLTANSVLEVTITAKNGQFTKNSVPQTVIVSETVPTNPLINYGVAQPVVEPATAGDTAVSGQVTLSEPIPDGTTFEVVVALPDGTIKTGKLNDDGTFTVDTGTLAAGDEVVVHVVAKNGTYQKDGSPVTVVVEADQNANPLEGYTVNEPIVNPMTADEMQVTGQVNLETPIPSGTTFMAVVTLADGTTTTAPVNDNGQFTVPTTALVADTNVAVKIVASNGTFTKDSTIIYQTVSPKLATDPLADYTVGTPVVDAVNADQTRITGQVTLAQPVPEGTTFEATVTLPDGTQKTAVVSADGHFEIEVGQLTADSQLVVKVTAKNSIYTKDSQPVTVIVAAGEVVDPLADYEVATPTLNPANAGEIQISGSVILKAAPAGTTFTAVMVMPNGRTRLLKIDSGAIAADGSFTITTAALTAGQNVRVKITATNGTFTKDGAAAEMIVGSAPIETNPLENYEVAQPTVDPVQAGDTEVTGSVVLTQPIPDGTTFEAVVTLLNGDQERVEIDGEGHFTLPIDAVEAGDELTVEVIAHNDGHEKAGEPVVVTVEAQTPPVTNPLVDYQMATPVIEQGTAGETQIKGTVQLTRPIPDGTTFTAVIVAADGRTRAVRLDSGAVTPDGHFTIQTAALTTGQKVQVKITAANGTFTKDSAIASMTVAKKPGNPIPDPDGNGNGNHGGQPGGNGAQPGATDTPVGPSGPITINSKVTTHFGNQSNRGRSWSTQRLPQTSAETTGIWSVIGLLLMTSVLWIKQLLPSKRDQ